MGLANGTKATSQSIGSDEMSRRVAFRQCDVTRAIRAAKMAGASRVVVRPDGSLAIELIDDEKARQTVQIHDIGKGKDIVL